MARNAVAAAVHECNDFVSYVHGRPHGDRVRLRVVPRAQPYAVGNVPGASHIRTHAHGSPVLQPECALCLRVMADAKFASEIHDVSAGDILVVNPAEPHFTAEFADAHATRRMLALFVSENALRACATSHAVAEANNLGCEMRVRKKRRR